MSHFYAMLFRMKYIDRWALMRNTRKETLAEHTLETAFIAHALAIIQNRRFGGSIDPEKVAVAALFHDAPEIITGDLPTPVKYYNEQIRDTYKEIERSAENRLLELLPDDLRPDIAATFKITDPEIGRFVKAADKISALLKCRDELSLGNRDFAAAEQQTLKAISDMNMPAADCFLEEFAASFSLPIDEQK